MSQERSEVHPDVREIVENTSNRTHTVQIPTLDKYTGLKPVVLHNLAAIAAIITRSAAKRAPMNSREMQPAAFGLFWTIAAGKMTMSSILAESVRGIHRPIVDLPVFSRVYSIPCVGYALHVLACEVCN